MSDEQQAEFSRPFDLSGLGRAARPVSLKARPEECRALARRLGLEELKALSAEITLRREASELVVAEGSITAEVTQRCVVTDEPFEALVETEFQRRYLLGRAAVGEQVDIDPEAEDPPEPLGSEDLDLGEVVAEELALTLDPYPRKPGLPPLDYSVGEEGAVADEEEKIKPFAALAALKGKKGS